MSWKIKKHLQNIVAQEEGIKIFAPGARTGFALAYPNNYNVAMSNLGIHILYEQINNRHDTACERFFYPDKDIIEEYSKTNTPLLSLETNRPLISFPLIGFAVTFELDYFNMIHMLNLAKIKVLASERSEFDPLIIMGGPCATFNPEPVANIVDICVIGEGEDTIHELLDVYHACAQKNFSRTETLEELSKVQGLYIPSLYEHIYDEEGNLAKIIPKENAPDQVHRRFVKNLEKYPAQSVIKSKNTEFNMHLIEVARGCGRHCRFCMAGYCFRNPRTRSIDTLKENLKQAIADDEVKKIGLMGAAISDYEDIKALGKYINDNHKTIAVASLRADSLEDETVSLLAQSGQKTITLAPEAGSERVRRIINKNITNEDLFRSISLAIKAGIKNVRYYIMIGLPYEETEDIEAIAALALKTKKYMEELGSKGKLTLSVNPFVPKPFTPFQWLPMANESDLKNKIKIITNMLKTYKNIEVDVEPLKQSFIQGVLARGDRKLTPVLIDAVKEGGLKGWRKMMKKYEINEDEYLYRLRSQEELLPWDIINMGFNKSYLYHELTKAKDEAYTAPCFKGCKRCGIC